MFLQIITVQIFKGCNFLQGGQLVIREFFISLENLGLESMITIGELNLLINGLPAAIYVQPLRRS